MGNRLSLKHRGRVLNAEIIPSIAVALSFVVLLIVMGSSYGQPPGSSPDLSDLIRLRTGTDPVALALLDLDGELGLDLVVLNSRPSPEVVQRDATLADVGSVSFFFGAGDGRFWEVPGFPEIPLSKEKKQRTVEDGIRTIKDLILQDTQPATLGVVDCDGDGVPNVLALGNRAKVITKRTPPQVAVTNPFMFNISLNISWEPDVGLMITSVIGLVNEPLYDSTPTSQSQELEVMQFAGGDPSMAVGDFDEDGREDFAIVNSEQFTLTIFRSEGSCVFKQLQHFDGIGGPGDEPRFVAAGDLNRDDHLDLVVVNGGILSKDSPAPARVFLGDGDGHFKGPLDAFGTTPQARSLVIEDFNNDGNSDLVVAGLRNLVVLEGEGTGSFINKRQIASLKIPEEQDVPVGLVAFDFDGNRQMDLAVANSGNGSVDIYRGDGSLSFDLHQEILMGGGRQPIALTAGDIDADGDGDLAVANRGTDEVVILLNDQGTFKKLEPSRVGPGLSSIAVGDFNADERMDLAGARSRNGRVDIQYGNEQGRWTKILIPLESLCGLRGSFPVAMVAVDFDGSGTDDLAVADFGLESVVTLSGQRIGLSQLSRAREPWSRAFRCIKYEVGRSPKAITAAHLNSDGKVDLAIVNSRSHNVYVLLGEGDGVFHTFQLKDQDPDEKSFSPSIPVGRFPTSIAAADFDGDGDLDLAVGNSGSGDVSILLGEGDGTFQEVQRPEVCDGPSALAVGDFNYDGKWDLAIACPEEDAIYILLGNDDNIFREAQRIQIPADQAFQVGVGPQALLADDLNGDGYTDLIVAGGIGSGTVYLLWNSGQGLRFTVQLVPQAISHPMSIALADLKGDGKQDLIVSTEFPDEDNISNEIFIVEDVGPSNGPPPRCQSPNSLTVGDFNGDGVQDVVGTCLVPINTQEFVSGVFLLLSEEDRRFQGPQVVKLEAHRGPTAVIAHHLNGDGRLDLAIAHAGTNTVSLLFGREDGSFDPPKDVLVGAAPVSLVTEDFNRDDQVDLTVAHQGSSDVWVLCGDGTGGFEKCVELKLTDVSPVALAAGDFNQDGFPDLAIAVLNPKGDRDQVQVFLNDRRGGFEDQPSALVSVGRSPQAFVVGQFNPTQDQYLDLAVVSLQPSADPENVTVLFGDGQGGFQSRGFTLEGSPTAVAVGDFNEDSSPDLAVTKQGPDKVSILLNDGDGTGTFRAAQTLPTGEGPEAIAVGDFDADGHADLVVANSGSDDLSILWGNGKGNFPQTERLKL